MIPQNHRDRGNRADPYTEPNSCFSDSSDSLNSLNSLNSMKVPLHLEKTPLILGQKSMAGGGGGGGIKKSQRKKSSSVPLVYHSSSFLQCWIDKPEIARSNNNGAGKKREAIFFLFLITFLINFMIYIPFPLQI